MNSNPLLDWLPVAASDAAQRTDLLFFSMVALTGTVTLGIFVVMTWFIVRYRRGSRADRSAPPSKNVALEAAWIAIPLLLFLGVFVWGAHSYSALYRVPPNADAVYVVAKQWMWKVQHPNGRREIDEVHVAAGRTVRIVMASQDVIHSFYVPAFRVKQDVVPGRYMTIAFTPTSPGIYTLSCAEYCGTHHAGMHGRIVVLPEADYARWLEAGPNEPGLAARGFELFRQLGCSGCHSERSAVHAPDLTALIGREVHLADGRSLRADESYVRDSILLPKKDVVAGYEPLMPSFAGQIGEEDLVAIVHYIRSTGRR